MISAASANARLMLLLACLCWGLSFPVGRALNLLCIQGEAGSSFAIVGALNCFRFIAAALLMSVVRPAVWRDIASREAWQGLILGVFGSAGILLQSDGLAYTTASNSAFLTQAYCIILPFIHCIEVRRGPDRAQVISIILVATGLSILAGVRWTDFRIGRGELETLVAAGFFAVQIVCLERPEFRTNRTGPVTVVMFLTMGITAGGFTCFESPQTFSHVVDTPAKTGLLIVLVVICTLVAFTLMNHYQRHIRAADAGVIYTFEPVFAAVFALFLPEWLGLFIDVRYPNEQISWSLLTGGALVVGANLWTYHNALRGQKSIEHVANEGSRSSFHLGKTSADAGPE